MLDTPAERERLLGALFYYHTDFVMRQARGDEDDLQDLLLKLLSSSPDLLAPDLAGYEIGQLDAKIEEVSEKLARSPEGSKRHQKWLTELGRLHHERDQITAGRWVRTVLRNKAIDRYRTELNRARILEAHHPELAYRYSSDLGPSAEWVVMRKLEDEDIRARLLRLPPKLAQVATLLYDGWTYREIAATLGMNEPAVRKRAQRINSPHIRAAIGL